MTQVLVIIHVMLAIALVGVVLLQRSEGGGLGIGGGGGGGGMGGFLTGRGTKSLLTQATAVLAAGFFITSLTLTWLESHRAPEGSLIDQLPISAPASTDTAPESPPTPTVPLE
ncbi:MAG: preprotein translocase subunit SecG [Pseudomonadota bacterium]